MENRTGNLLEADVEALVNTVNTVGVMGKGIALQFRQAFPENYNAYRKACSKNEVVPGKMFVFRTGTLTNPRYIINFPTKRHWKGKTRVEDVEEGLVDLVKVIRDNSIRSIAIPPLGCGNGGLNWNVVLPMIESALAALTDVNVLLYAPTGAPDAEKMRVATKCPRMTLNRAAIIHLMDRYAMPGYRMSQLEIQKLAYLLQEAGQPLKLQFSKNIYGPYAEHLQHALQNMEGHYIRGYGDRSQRSRDASIQLLPGAAAKASDYLCDHPATQHAADVVKSVIDGFESPYGLELLASIHYLAKEDESVKASVDLAVHSLHSWNEHKRRTFEAKHIAVAWRRLCQHNWLM